MLIYSLWLYVEEPVCHTSITVVPKVIPSIITLFLKVKHSFQYIHRKAQKSIEWIKEIKE